MIDIHHHCLPDVDDGPRNLEQSVQLCRMAAANGVETIIATPHVLRGRWKQVSSSTLQSTLTTLQAAVGPHPRIVLGSEYFFGHDMQGALQRGEIIPLAGSRYFLVEFPAHSLPPMIDSAFYQVQLDGWVPVIAHPERNLGFQQKPELLMQLIMMGAKSQVTLGSLRGDFGRVAKGFARTLLERRMVHFLATDAHNVLQRPPLVSEAVAIARALIGNEADPLTDENPRCVLDGKPLEFDPEPLPPPGLLDHMRRWVGTSRRRNRS